jgi:hypothetical protein
LSKLTSSKLQKHDDSTQAKLEIKLCIGDRHIVFLPTHPPSLSSSSSVCARRRILMLSEKGRMPPFLLQKSVTLVGNALHPPAIPPFKDFAERSLENDHLEIEMTPSDKS